MLFKNSYVFVNKIKSDCSTCTSLFNILSKNFETFPKHSQKIPKSQPYLSNIIYIFYFKNLQTKSRFQSNSVQSSCKVMFRPLVSFPVRSDLVQVSRLLKQLEVQSDDDLPRGNLVEQQPLCDWSFRALVLFYFSQPDLSPTKEVCGDKWRTEDEREDV